MNKNMKKGSFDVTVKTHNEFGKTSSKVVEPSSSSSSSDSQNPPNSNQVFFLLASKHDPLIFNFQQIQNSSNLIDPSLENPETDNQRSNSDSFPIAGTLNLAPLIQKL